MKTRQENNVTNRTSAVYAENNTELLRPIELGEDCDENQIKQRHERSYKCDLYQK